jgi:hypothetical protein
VYVLTGSAATAATLRPACEPINIEVRHSDSVAVAIEDDLLAVFYEAGHDPVPMSDVRRHGAYAIWVAPAPATPTEVLAAIRHGYHLVLASPLRIERVRSLLGYLAEVASPAPAQVLALDAAGTMSTPSRSVRLSPEEAAVLRTFAKRQRRIVPRQDLANVIGEAELRSVLAALSQHMEEVGSGARLLPVPHIGVRLSGSVRIVDD